MADEYTTCLDCVHFENTEVCADCVHDKGATECFERDVIPDEVQATPNKTELALNAIFAALNAYTTEKSVMLGATYIVQQYLANADMIRTIMADAGINDPEVLNILREFKEYFVSKATIRSSVLEGGCAD